MGNTIETLCIFLSTTAIGALFSSSSTDMGSKGILERLRQIEPKLVFMEDTAVYNRKIIDLREKIKEVMEGMKGARQLQELISVPRFEKPRYIGNLPRVTPLSIFLASAPRGNHTLEFERIGFDEGFLIVYSSGTTGPPKCIVHSVAVLLTAFKEGMLHRNLGPTSTALQFTTTGWIMYLASIQTLMHGAKLIMYDGSPFLPSVDSFLRLAATQGVTHFGTSPRYLAAMQSAGVIPKNIRGLEKLKLVTSTGMVLPPALYNWFYSSSGFPSTVHLGNIAGGTDLAGGFGDCNALLPVYSSGGCQGLSLGMDVRVYDSTILPSDPAPKGKEVPIGEPGDLVAVQPFPNQPIGFWGDSKDHTKYRDAYFNRFDNVWTHGDFVHFHPVTKALIYLGRADGVLNPSGVRFGSAEIYSVLEAPEFAGDIADALCVGRRRKQDTDEVVMLFLKMRPGKNFSQDLVKRIKDAIAKALSRRHVPKFVFETPEIPATVNGKKVELPIKKIVSGEKITVSGTLANPECLKWYEQFALLEEGDAGGFVRSKL